jgi:hypothetical protein
MNPLIIQLFSVFGPIAGEIIQRYMASHNGQLPTDAEMLQEFEMNIEEYLHEGNAWLKAHPK